MEITRDEIMFIREKRIELLSKDKFKVPVQPSWKYRVAMATTKAPYNFKKVKALRKMAKNSRRINRKKG